MSVEELVLLEERGVRVVCPEIPMMATPRRIENVLDMSVRAVLTMIRKGLSAVGEVEEAPEGSVLEWARRRIRGTGLSHEEIAERCGVTRQAIQHLMRARSVQTRTLDVVMRKLELI